MSNMIMLVISGLLLCCCIPVSFGGAVDKNEKFAKGDEDGRFAFPDELNIGQFRREHNHMPFHHHHSPDFYHHEHHHYNSNGFKEEESEDVPRNFDPNTTMQIPLEFIQKINEYNVSDLLLHFVEGDENETPVIQDRFNIEDERAAAVVTPKGAGCMPELTTIKLVPNADPSLLYIPQCTRIERCGGCCSHPLLACQPQDKEYINFKVIKTQYTGGQKLKLMGKEIVAVERHTKCKCDCRVQPQDCNKFQVYKKSECRCACTNSDEEKKCYKNNNTKLWNPDLCACQCKETMQCSTGSYFDQNECRCVPIPVKRRGANYSARKYRNEAFPTIDDEN